MQTVNDVLKILNNIDKLFKDNHDINVCLKIDLFMSVDDKIFFEALRRNEVSDEDFISISYSRHNDKKYFLDNEELFNNAKKIYDKRVKEYEEYIKTLS